MGKGYKNLDVWNRAYGLTLKIYDVTRSYPKNETFGLTSQMRRAAASTVANIAEGYSRRHLREYIQFVSVAIGSSNELEVFLRLSKDLNYVSSRDYEELNSTQEEIGKMLFGLRKSLEKKESESAH